MLIAKVGLPRHELKTWPDFFQAIVDGKKTAELRFDDRGFQVYHLLWLREWDQVEERYTGREASAIITHILRGDTRFGLAEGFVMMSLGRVAMWFADRQLTQEPQR